MKWIISDLDGTLLNDDRTVGIKTISGIRTLLKKGYPFVIATGRGFASANTIREKLGVAIYMICNNGATIYSPKGELIFENYIPVDVVKKVTAYLEKYRVDYRGFFQNYYFMPSYGRKDEKRVEYKAIVLEREEDFQHLEKLLVVDPNTISFKTEEPFAPLLNHLTHKTASILSKQYYEEVGDKYFENPVGTGPYMLKEWKIGDHIELEANPTYFDGEPSIKHVVFRGIPEESNKVIGLQTGEIDMVGDVEAVSRETISGDSNLELKEGSSVSTIYLGMNTERKIFADKDVRKAISMGVNRDDIVNSLLAGAGQKANSFLAPTVFGYSKDSKVYEYNPEEAKKIIEEKGLVGSKIKIAVSNSQLRSQMAEIIQAQLKEIGLEVSIENLEWGTFLSATANGEVDMFILGWGPSTYDGDYGLFPNFHSSQKGGSGNRSQYANPKMDQLLEEGRKEMDVEKRRDLYKQAADLINEEAVVLPLYYSLTSVGYRKAIKGVKAESYPMIHKYSY